MLTLCLLRHAKSSWKDPTLPDHDRPLNSRGRTEAPLMGKQIRKHGLDPELVLCSTARRTRDTLALVLPELKAEPKTIYEDGLYHGSPRGEISDGRSGRAALPHRSVEGRRHQQRQARAVPHACRREVNAHNLTA